MNIKLKKANYDDLELIYKMQIEAFTPLFKKYKDDDTSPANEPLERIIQRFSQPFTDYYLIMKDNQPIGGIRIICRGNQRYRVSPIFVLPQYQGRGIAQRVFNIIEAIYVDA